nr:WYL domain-containing protein [Suttonella ornithocola]
MLTRLNYGERLAVAQLAEDYHVHPKTIKRDLEQRFGFLDYAERGSYYRLNKNKQGHLNKTDIQHFAIFAGLQHLFPEAERLFFQNQLNRSVHVKGFQYENIRNKQAEFDALSQAINTHHRVRFRYQKIRSGESKIYQLEPYRLVNKNGIWYLIGLDNGKQKTYCFSQISELTTEEHTFIADETLLADMLASDSLYHGNQLKEILIKVSAQAAGYFTRRALLPNQETIRELDDGGLILACKNVHANEVLPIVQYWLPHAHIVSPEILQNELEKILKNYLGIERKNEEK